jgi:hypothetical protein
MDHTLGSENATDPFPIGLIQTRLSHNFAACYPVIHDEVVQSFNDLLALDGSGESRRLGLGRGKGRVEIDQPLPLPLKPLPLQQG